ncbi:hypothetical protein [Mucilaginibacter phyllosphaerae]|uniref:Alpha-L-rhamnosidase six-hairpin glycosidase domain-containing protein n=1 Tax=Mucilaginibacter phyllosphaerae TaxID=1812349 RepID=A0ABR6I8V9_9SPHI|nr:hypothetical protein [Mucilaginibacter phyllosphaerae]MBB3969480.1 hypothetical protein [Mucilaginibacter phyllosphaerae]GGH08874.1 hypothetical protein GCM10007352_14100 [Mucilaginibacter phyllosphaerae]
MQQQVTTWALNASPKILNDKSDPIYRHQAGPLKFKIQLLDDSLWIITGVNDKSCTAFRTAFAPGGMTVDKIDEFDKGVNIKLTGNSGEFNVTVDFPAGEHPVLHYLVKFKPKASLCLPFWPKDILFVKKGEEPEETDGELFVKQIGIRSGVVYAGIKKPGKGSFLYFQNLTSLNDYCIETETSVAETVGGKWPEFGYSLPVTKDKPLPAGIEFIISDAYVSFSTQTPADQFEVANGYLDHLAAIYKLIPKPKTKYQPFQQIVNYSLADLESNKGCWSQHKGCSYLNAYVCDYSTPPEIMVQLAVLLPIWDYQDWKGEQFTVANQIYDNIQTFWNDELQTIKRWLPSVEDELDESEEQKVPNTMDSWYLHHPLLNLARMALAGDEMAKDLFLRSIDYAIKVAHHFNYEWPVFYNMKTLEVLKEETEPGMGGEKDVAGVYAQVMLQAWDLTGDRRFLEEAKVAAKSLIKFGFDIFYQANNVAFSTKAFLRLYKDTSDKVYLDLCHLFVANMLKNVAIWECEYGYGKNFPLFFGLFPLNNAPYLAVYEEQECFASIHDLLAMAEGTDFSESARLLLGEYVKYMTNRAVYYYPPMLPKDMLSEETKTGEIDPKLWIALEDIHDGWEKAGVVGQEVYGAGMCFGIVPRHYTRIPGQDFMVYIEYPTGRKKITEDTLTIKVLGSKEFTCRLCIVPVNEDTKLPQINILCGNSNDQEQFDHQPLNTGNTEFTVHGDQTIIIKWAADKNKRKQLSYGAKNESSV